MSEHELSKGAENDLDDIADQPLAWLRMPEPGTDDLARLTASLRKWLRGQDDREQRLSRAQGRLLLDELGRLQQSNDRLRKQNRRLRARGVTASAADEAPPTDGPAPASDPAPAKPDS